MPDEKVVTQSLRNYKGDFYADLMEQYKVFRTTIKEAQDDRNTNNRFLLGICTALIGAEGYLLRQFYMEKQMIELLLFSCLLAVIGVFICIIWIRSGKSYSIAIGTRYKVLKGIEAHFPSQPFQREKLLRNQHDYVAISDISVMLSKVFLISFLLMLLFTVINYIFLNEFLFI